MTGMDCASATFGARTIGVATVVRQRRVCGDPVRNTCEVDSESSGAAAPARTFGQKKPSRDVVFTSLDCGLPSRCTPRGLRGFSDRPTCGDHVHRMARCVVTTAGGEAAWHDDVAATGDTTLAGGDATRGVR
mmetsp:Transcript_85595/g.239013  ORF Transcript_85595/g.239013 Transcript_85595/m.239013 type:complete len:132 (+) Transcript_85595:199-594(+)